MNFAGLQKSYFFGDFIVLELNTNVNAKKIENQIKKTDRSINSSIEKLSTGKNTVGKDKNLASIGQASKTISQVNALEALHKNIIGGVSLLDTANDSLSDIKNILFKMKELSVKAASASYSGTDRTLLNTENSLLLEQIDTIVSSTRYNNQKLIDGTFIDKKVMTNVNSSLNDALTISISSATVTELFDFTPPTFANGDFSNGTENWTVVNGQIKFGQNGTLGETSVAGFQTPIDSSPVANTGNQVSRGDDFAPNSATYNSEIVNESLRLFSDMTTQQGGDIVHGPYVVSNESTYIEAGRSVSFKWRAQGGSDAFDVYAYVVNVDNGQTIELLNETGSGTTDSGWQTRTISIDSSGNYKFVFSSGTFDETFGQAAGASLYIDDIVVTGTPTVLNNYDDVASLLTQTKANSTNTAVDAAIEKVNVIMSNVGSYRNRLQHALDVNLSEAGLQQSTLSKITDTNYAAEASSLLKSQIIRQAGMDILNKAKLNPEIVLKLLE